MDTRSLPPEFITNAIPGAPKLADAAKAARQGIRDTAKARTAAAEKAAAVSRYHLADPHNAPKAGVTRATFTRAIDAYRDAVDAEDVAAVTYRRALAALHAHIAEGMEDPDFIDAHEALYADASRRAKAALEALKSAVDERDMLARDVIGRRITTPHGWSGMTFHTSHLTEYIDANLADDDALAWRTVEDTLAESIVTPDTRITVVRECQAVRELDIPADAKRAQYLRVLARHGLGQQARRA